MQCWNKMFIMVCAVLKKLQCAEVGLLKDNYTQKTLNKAGIDHVVYLFVFNSSDLQTSYCLEP